MVLTNDITSTEPAVPIESSMQGEVGKNLLDLSPSDIVFYVGGYPTNFTVSSQEQGIETSYDSVVVQYLCSFMKIFLFLLLLSHQDLSISPCTKAALSSPLSMIKSSVSIIS